ncbi:MAG: sulfatase [Planctomycetes bacterium]|nr:sulfatase [Planctomycetota bacterium]
MAKARDGTGVCNANPVVLRRRLMSSIVITISLLSTAHASCAEQAHVPNIVLIFADDLGYGDIGPFGSTKNRTPQLDRMTREGMKLTSFYAAPVCSVSRAQVMTGCYGQRVSVPHVFFPAERHGINPAEITVAELLKQQQYSTMCIGKWHLGDQPEFLPTRHGFDHYFGIPYSNDMNKPNEAGVPVVPLLRDEHVADLLDAAGQNSVTARYTEEAVQYIRDHTQHPFFLYFPHTAVHVPLHPGDPFRGKSANGNYGDWVEEIDWSVGRILDTLRETKLSERTLVIFTSDNGPWLTQGKNGGEAGPLRGGKGSTWEGGVREPTVAWWPGTIAAGSTCDSMAGNIDLLPTFVSLAGGAVPTDRAIDGRDITPLLLGKTTQSPRDVHYYYRRYNLEAVRSGPWKLALGPQVEARGKGGDAPDAKAPGVRLYNLVDDIGERTNVAQTHPEIVRRLQGLADRMARELGNGTPGPAVRPIGEVASPKLLYATRAAQPSRPVDLKSLKIGDTIPAAAAPQIGQQPFSIKCEIQPTINNAVIVAHGGSAVGYALSLKEGRVSFSVRTQSDELTTITAPEVLQERIAIDATLAKDGTMTLSLNGTSVATGKAPRLIPHQPQEKLCIGHDDGNPVGNYDGSIVYSGVLEKLLIGP